jgi:hypothetical protein
MNPAGGLTAAAHVLGIPGARRGDSAVNVVLLDATTSACISAAPDRRSRCVAASQWAVVLGDRRPRQSGRRRSRTPSSAPCQLGGRIRQESTWRLLHNV